MDARAPSTPPASAPRESEVGSRRQLLHVSAARLPFAGKAHVRPGTLPSPHGRRRACARRPPGRAGTRKPPCNHLRSSTGVMVIPAQFRSLVMMPMFWARSRIGFRLLSRSTRDERGISTTMLNRVVIVTEPDDLWALFQDPAGLVAPHALYYGVRSRCPRRVICRRNMRFADGGLGKWMITSGCSFICSSRISALDRNDPK